MFNEIKNRVTIVDAYDKYCPGTPLRARGTNDYVPEDDVCPWHGGHGSFHIMFDDAEPEKGFAKCFSSACIDEAPADVIEFVRRTQSLETPKEAAQLIIKDFNLNLVFEVSTSQKIFNEAAEYYHNLLMTTKIYESLGKKSPLDYQEQVRGHKQSTLLSARVGWTDNAELCKHLAMKGFSNEEIIASGLGAGGNSGIRDKLPKESFVYVAFVNGRASRFTFKTLRLGADGKPLAFQLKKEFWLNDVVVMGQDSVKNAEDVAVVEGENDMLSLIDMGWEGGIICLNGQPSRIQYEYIAEALRHKRVHTFYDNDDAGEKYRLNTWKWAKGEIHQYKVPEQDGDVDLYIQRRRSDELNPVERLLNDGEVSRPNLGEAANADLKVTGAGTIIEKDGCYFGLKEFTSANGDARETLTQLTNFTLKIKTVYLHRGERIREMEFTRQDGARSGAVFLNSAARSSLRLFKEFCSKSCDGIFLGSDSDLNNLWLHIASTQRERVVTIPEYCGYVAEINMWVFRNVMINNATGAVYYPDERGIFWTQPGHGIMPQSISSDILNDGISGDDAIHIPRLLDDIKDHDEFMEYQGAVLDKLSKIIGIPEACTLMAWAQANAFSNVIFQSQNFFPMLQLWGRHGKGKTTLLQWVLSTFDMLEANKGYMVVSAMDKSTVGFQRKVEYYSSLPVIVDELRADFKTKEHYSMWRGMFNRAPRTLGTPRQGVVKMQKVRANIGFGGQDSFTDAALQSRCVGLKTSSMRSTPDSQRAYNWLNEEVEYFSRFGYHWVMESTRTNKVDLEASWEEMKDLINANLPKNSDVGSRTKEIWKVIGWFAMRFMETYFPGEEYLPWMMEQIKQDVVMQEEVDIVTEFWNKIASCQVSSRPSLTSEHVTTDGKKLYVWFPGTIDAMEREIAHLGHARSTIRTAITEEPYFTGETTHRMGAGNHQRRVLAFDLEAAPTVVKEIASVSEDFVANLK
jgi:5S rRNA maturation endonuclease (ribonuclease M5)